MLRWTALPVMTTVPRQASAQLPEELAFLRYETMPGILGVLLHYWKDATELRLGEMTLAEVGRRFSAQDLLINAMEVVESLAPQQIIFADEEQDIEDYDGAIYPDGVAYRFTDEYLSELAEGEDLTDLIGNDEGMGFILFRGLFLQDEKLIRLYCKEIGIKPPRKIEPCDYGFNLLLRQWGLGRYEVSFNLCNYATGNMFLDINWQEWYDFGDPAELPQLNPEDVGNMLRHYKAAHKLLDIHHKNCVHLHGHPEDAARIIELWNSQSKRRPMEPWTGEQMEQNIHDYE